MTEKSDLRERARKLGEGVIAIYDKVMGDEQSSDELLAIAREVVKEEGK